MSGFYSSGLITGFTQRKRELEDRQREDDRRNSDKEGRIYEALLQSPDPEIQSMAFSGLLNSASPKKAKGLRGWMGEMEKNPALEGIRKLIGTPVQETQQVQAGPPALTGYMPGTPAPTGSAAQTTNSPTQGGEPPLQPLPSRSTIPAPESAPNFTMETGVAARPPGPPPLAAGPPDLGQPQGDPRLGVSPTASITTSRPRQVFSTPEQQYAAQAKGKAQGDIQGEMAGLVAAGVSPAEAQATVLLKMRRAAGLGAKPPAPFQAVAGETLDESTGKWRPTYGTFNKQTGSWQDAEGKPLTSFRRTATGTSSMTGRGDTGLIREGIAQREYGMSLSQLAIEQPEALMDVAEKAEQFKQTSAGATTTARKTAENETALDKPVDLKTSQATGAPVGARQKEFAGQQVPSQESMKAELSLKTVKEQLAELIAPSDGRPSPLDILPSQHELIGGKIPGVVMGSRRISNRAEVARLEAAIGNIAGALQKATEDPRISDKDIERANNRIASMGKGLFDLTGGDTRESALARIRETIQALELSESNRIKRPTPGGAAGVSAAPGAPPPGAAGKTKSAAPAGKGPSGTYIDKATGHLWMNGVDQDQ